MDIPSRITVADTQVLFIDLQEKLMPLIADREAIVARCQDLIAAARLFGLPVTATEQYTSGLGHTVEPLGARLKEVNARFFEKLVFCATGLAGLREHLVALDRPNVIVAGVEAHICVLQTAIDLQRRGWQAFVCADAIGSRHEFDFEMALVRMQQAGVVVSTVESLLFELCEECGTERFRRMLEIVKARDRREPGAA